MRENLYYFDNSFSLPESFAGLKINFTVAKLVYMCCKLRTIAMIMRFWIFLFAKKCGKINILFFQNAVY